MTPILVPIRIINEIFWLFLFNTLGLFLFNTLDAKLGEDAKIEFQEFQKCCNGGGLFHKSARIDPSARIEIGALVHSDSIVGANVYVGSGSVVGPAVTIGQSTRTGYSSLLILEFN